MIRATAHTIVQRDGLDCIHFRARSFHEVIANGNFKRTMIEFVNWQPTSPELLAVATHCDRVYLFATPMEVQCLPDAVAGKPCVGRFMLRLFATPFRVLLTRCLDHSSSRATESLKPSKGRDDRSDTSLRSMKKRVPAQTATPPANRSRRQKVSRPVGRGYDPGSGNPIKSEKPISHMVTTVKLETGGDASPRRFSCRRRAISWLIPHIEDASLKEVILHILARWHHNDQFSDSESTGKRQSITWKSLGLNHQPLFTFCVQTRFHTYCSGM